MTLRSTLLSIILAGAFCAPALAVTDEDLQRDLALAQYVFPYACHQHHPLIEVGVDHDPANTIDAYTDIGGNAGCWVVLDDAWQSWEPWVLCRIVLHEVGHLAGLQHTLNVNSIMYPNARKSRSRRCRMP